MAFDLIIWKWADGQATADVEEIVEAISDDNPHPALTRFDMAEFEAALRDEFGSVNEEPESPFLYDVSDFKGVPANWMTLSVSWSQVETVCPKIVDLAHTHHLAVFDPQSGRVW